jgi:hypothetical protein
MVNNKQDPTIEELKLVLFTVMFLGKMQQYQEKYSG